MEGFEAAYAGRSLVGLPQELTDALAKYSGQSVTLGLRQGKPEALAEALKVLGDERGDRARQLQLLQVLGEVRRPACVAVVLRLACQSSDNALRTAALNALANYDDPGIAPRCWRLTPICPTTCWRPPRIWSRLAARGRPVSSNRSNRMLSILAPYRTRLSRDFCSSATHESRTGLPETSARSSRPARPSKTRESTSLPRRSVPARGSPSRVSKSMTDQCARCHVLFGKGGKVGPDLTTYRRDDLETMLRNIVNPSAEIREGYNMLIIATTDGRVLTGVLVEQDKNVVVLRGGDGKEVTLPRSEIDSMRPGRGSMMPEGLLNEYNPQQIRDLFAYLRSTQPLID